MTYPTGPRKRPLILLLLILGPILGPISGHTVELNYVDPELRQALASDFDRADHDVAILSTNWVCELVGVRTGLQHEHNLPLYQFSSLNTQGQLQNVGASPVKKLRWITPKKQLHGTQGRISEEIRFLSSSEIISKMVNSETKQALAYARCRPHHNSTAALTSGPSR